ncbi:EAL domain-containing protein [uncultured Cellulomonas sp.]|uniref:EAL domain-containing protein n=1 Tax=uncultured Cellulomonas sp. TaxID=189682 RepID=UPI002627D2EC|nr:EAL domain-containing protein [uncultured Cellulomonas sp.]
MAIMTADLAAIAVAVDSAVSPAARAEWEASRRRHTPRLARRRVFRVSGREYGVVLGPAGVPRQCAADPARDRSDLLAGGDGQRADHGADARRAADDLRSAFRDLDAAVGTRSVFVRVTRAFLAGDLPLPRRPRQIVVESDGTAECDGVVRDGLLRLKSLGCRISLGDFTGRADQRRLLPLADFVKIDARDLDLEGRPLLELAASRGARLIADFVDSSAVLQQCRSAGFGLVQGAALERLTTAPGFARTALPRG